MLIGIKMKRFSIVFALAVVLILGTSVLAETLSISENTQEFVKDVASKKGISESSIQDIQKVDFEDLPEEINIQNIDETAISMYKISVEGEEPVYVITASDEEIKTQVQALSGKMLLNLGLSGEVSGETFLASSAGVIGSKEKGYVMMRDGSVTGISTSLETTTSSNGEAEIIIIINGEAVGLRNTFDLSKTGIKSDYDLSGQGNVKFHKGDIVSVKVILPNGAVVEDINTLLEVTGNE